MVYIYKKFVGNKTYYYLRISKRKGNKVVIKDIAYLGTNIDDVKRTLNNLPKYKDDIRKAYRTINNFIESNRYVEKIRGMKIKIDKYLNYEDLINVEACKLHFNTIFNKQDKNTKAEIFKNFIVEFAFNTTSIEGNTINLEEARNLLLENLTPKNKSLREIYDLQNTEKVFFEIINTNKELNHKFIEYIHKGLMENIDLRSNFKATPAPYVNADMDILLKWYNKNKDNLHPLILASVFHHKFEKIHPFMDGNGRTGRMLLNFILMKHKYPPTIIYKKERTDYLGVLREADKSNLTELEKSIYLSLLSFISNELNSTYWNIFL